MDNADLRATLDIVTKRAETAERRLLGPDGAMEVIAAQGNKATKKGK
mgnify:FL=1